MMHLNRNSFRQMDSHVYVASDSPVAVQSRQEMAAALNNTKPAGATIGERSKYLANQAWTRTLGGLANTFASFGAQYVTLRYSSNLPLASFMGGTAVAAMKATVLKALEHAGPNLKLPKASEGNLYSRQELFVKITDGLLDSLCYMLAAVVTSKAKELVEAHNSDRAFAHTLQNRPDTLLALAATSAGFDVAHYMLTAFVTACVPSARYELKSWNALKQAAGQNLAAGKHLLLNGGGTREALKSNVDFVIRMGVNAAGTAWLPLSDKLFHTKELEYAQAGPAKAAAGSVLRTFQGPLKDYVFNRVSDYKKRNESPQQNGTLPALEGKPPSNSPDVRIAIQDDSAARLRHEIEISILNSSEDDSFSGAPAARLPGEQAVGRNEGLDPVPAVAIAIQDLSPEDGAASSPDRQAVGHQDNALDPVRQAILAAARIPLPDDAPVETPAASSSGVQTVGRDEDLDEWHDAVQDLPPENESTGTPAASSLSGQAVGRNENLHPAGVSRVESSSSTMHTALSRVSSFADTAAGRSSRFADTAAGESSRFGMLHRWLGRLETPRPGNHAAQPAMARESLRHSLAESDETSLLGESRRSHISVDQVPFEPQPGGFSPLREEAQEPAPPGQAAEEHQRSRRRK